METNKSKLAFLNFPILQLDNSIRFAGIAHFKGKLVAEAYREGLVPLLTKQETDIWFTSNSKMAT